MLQLIFVLFWWYNVCNINCLNVRKKKAWSTQLRLLSVSQQLEGGECPRGAGTREKEHGAKLSSPTTPLSGVTRRQSHRRSPTGSAAACQNKTLLQDLPAFTQKRISIKFGWPPSCCWIGLGMERCGALLKRIIVCRLFSLGRFPPGREMNKQSFFLFITVALFWPAEVNCFDSRGQKLHSFQYSRRGDTTAGLCCYLPHCHQRSCLPAC